MLTDTQHEYLIRPLKPGRVEKTQGMAYLEAFDVIAHLTRVFGWEGWDKELLQLDLIFEDVADKKRQDGTPYPVYTVAYRCSMRLTIRDPHGIVVKVVEDVGTGEAINQPSRGDAHDLASKSAVSGALKRCAKDLGDQFGLGLYDKGSLEPTVRKSIAYDPVVTLNASPAAPASATGRRAAQGAPEAETGQIPPSNLVAGETPPVPPTPHSHRRLGRKVPRRKGLLLRCRFIALTVTRRRWLVRPSSRRPRAWPGSSPAR